MLLVAFSDQRLITVFINLADGNPDEEKIGAFGVGESAESWWCLD